MAVTYRHPVKKKLRRRWWIYFNCYENSSRAAATVKPNIGRTLVRNAGFLFEFGRPDPGGLGFKIVSARTTGVDQLTAHYPSQQEFSGIAYHNLL